jgi:2'-5' RNA ligase
MPVYRAFIAIELPIDFQRQLERISRDMQAKLRNFPIKWVPIDSIHITIKFLGDISTSNLEVLTGILAGEVSRHQQFTISSGDLGAFPNLRRPRVIWVGIQAPDNLNALQKGVETGMDELGYPPEDRPYSPHLTLARIANDATPDMVKQIGTLLAGYHIESLGNFSLASLHVFRSDLKPTGAIYTRLFSAPLSR